MGDRRPRGRVLRRLLPFLFVGVAFFVIARLPSGTDARSIATRAAVGLVVGGAGVLVVRRMLVALADPPPPAPEKVDAVVADVSYECTLCGTRLRLEVASTGKAPRHCGEQMEARVGRS
ncbi:MAG TPA: hypothetical protein VNE62_08735 [Actinomycetota bacterium]|nr:hypothetical protein [Actinomycetota bacterium]